MTVSAVSDVLWVVDAVGGTFVVQYPDAIVFGEDLFLVTALGEDAVLITFIGQSRQVDAVVKLVHHHF